MKIKLSEKAKILFFFILKFCFFSFFFYTIYYNATINTSLLEKINVLLISKIFYGKIVNLPSYYHKENTWALLVKDKNKELYFIVDRDCLGINIYFALLTFIFSFPFFSFGKKIVLTILHFFLVFFVLNPIRLITLYYLFLNNFEFYLIFHNLIWQITNVLITLFLIIVSIKIKNCNLKLYI